MEDQQIVDLYWARCENAIEETSRKYGTYCHSIAFRILENTEDADESVNDTYLAAWEAIPPHRPATLSTFLGKITRRLSIQRWRRQNAGKRGSGEIPLALDELSDCIPSTQNVEQEFEAGELAEILNEFMQTLSKNERELFLGRYWFLLSIAEISARSGFKESRTKMILLRTRKKLRDYLQKRGY